MSRLDRYILRQIVLVTVLITIGLSLVAWLTQSVRLVELAVDRGLSAWLFFWLTFLLVPTVLSIVLPVALFAGVTFVYNRLASDRELVVIRSAGVSQLALARPVLAASAIAVLLGYALTLYLLPASYRAFRDLQSDIRNNYASVLIQEGVFTQVVDGVTVYVRKRGPDGALHGVLVHDDREPASPVTALAQRGAVRSAENRLRMVLVNGIRQELRRGVLSELQFDRYEFDLGIEGRSATMGWRQPKERFLSELFVEGDASWPVHRRFRLHAEGHDRLAQPLLNAALPLMALALLLTAPYDRRGQRRRILAATGALVAVEAAALSLKSLGGREPAFALLLYVVPLAAGAVSLFLLRRRPRDAARAALP